MRRFRTQPLVVILLWIAALAMLLPAAHAAATGDARIARTFLFGAVVVAALTGMAALAMAGRPLGPNPARSQLASFALAYLVVPPVLALPFAQAVPDTSFTNAWWEMVSSLTTTGATLYDTPGRLADSLHLWRALVGWFGGLLMLVGAAALLAPLDLAGAEVISGRAPGRGARGTAQITRVADPGTRLARLTMLVFPVYGGLTLALWVLLLIAGEDGLRALCLAMSTLSSSGIVPGQGAALPGAGLPGEMLVFAFLLLGLTRRSFPGAVMVDRSHPIWFDPEVRLAAGFLVLVPTVLFLRHWVGAVATDEVGTLGQALGALWGALFMTLSFLTTAGFESGQWQAARAWSGLPAPGLILVGLAMIGGGIATTTGGLKLLRVHALVRQGQRELERIAHPHSIGGGGDGERRLRNEGAYAAWIFFMLYALTLAVLIAALALVEVPFEQALVLSVAAVSTTGPLASLAAEAPVAYSALGGAAKAILAAAMVMGRLEVLAILALIAPSVWRR
ncbi:MAG: potassium transporter TrkG [Gemmobacter sp.]